MARTTAWPARPVCTDADRNSIARRPHEGRLVRADVRATHKQRPRCRRPSGALASRAGGFPSSQETPEMTMNTTRALRHAAAACAFLSLGSAALPTLAANNAPVILVHGF